MNIHENCDKKIIRYRISFHHKLTNAKDVYLITRQTQQLKQTTNVHEIPCYIHEMFTVHLRESISIRVIKS